MIESNALDSTSASNDTKEKQAILSFPKQLEICQKEIEYVVQRLCDVNRGAYYLDLRELFFASCLQGGRKYNLLAKVAAVTLICQSLLQNILNSLKHRTLLVS